MEGVSSLVEEKKQVYTRVEMRVKQCAFVAWFVLMCIGCSSVMRTNEISFWDSKTLEKSGPVNSLSEQLNALVESNPTHVLEESLENGDRRFVGVMGVGLVVPGFERDESLVVKNGIKVVSWTSDHIESDEQKLLLEQAFGFANTYNAKLKKLIHVGDFEDESRKSSEIE